MYLKAASLFVILSLNKVAATAHQINISVTGAPIGGLDPEQAGTAPARMNINDLYRTGGPAWDLYVQALAELQAVDENDTLSYFQIMGEWSSPPARFWLMEGAGPRADLKCWEEGIHGLPFGPYNGVGQVPGGADLAGFCPHQMLLFGLWHRPYVALYEQVLVSHALNISMRYSEYDAPTYRTAAESLRVAYWDWAQDATLPKAVTLETVAVNGPAGRTIMRNPFHRYYFQNFPFAAPYMDRGTLSRQNHTTRCPTADLVDNITMVNEGLAASGNLKAQVYEVFTMAQAFQDMETTAYGRPSFEGPHNNVHDSVGCPGGTMHDLNWSAFDPIFMLHHANVDRLIALWQAIHPGDAGLPGGVVGAGAALYGTAAGGVGADTPLKPFYAPGGRAFHTGRSARDVAAFGYTYPELSPAGPGGAGREGAAGAVPPGELADYVRTRVNALYGDGSAAAAGHAWGRRRGRNPAAAAAAASAASKTWSVALRVDKARVDLPAAVRCYLGEGLVGKMALLEVPASGVTHSTVPLDWALSAAGLDLADEDAVVAHLARELRFGVQKGDGSNLDAACVPGLEVAVVDRDVTPRRSDHEFPTYGPATSRPWPLGG